MKKLFEMYKELKLPVIWIDRNGTDLLVQEIEDGSYIEFAKCYQAFSVSDAGQLQTEIAKGNARIIDYTETFEMEGWE